MNAQNQSENRDFEKMLRYKHVNPTPCIKQMQIIYSDSYYYYTAKSLNIYAQVLLGLNL
ncbi:MAG: hypothetical protein FWD52_08275 [Candidatus Bathyarchaeota archaeon]|nr:hypothetical protein [Candidatus Termiticorpusculum sp.]